MSDNTVVVLKEDLAKVTDSNNKTVYHHQVLLSIQREWTTLKREQELLNEKLKVLELRVEIQQKDIQLESYNQEAIKREIENKYSISFELGSVDLDTGVFELFTMDVLREIEGR